MDGLPPLQSIAWRRAAAPTVGEGLDGEAIGAGEEGGNRGGEGAPARFLRACAGHAWLLGGDQKLHRPAGLWACNPEAEALLGGVGGIVFAASRMPLELSSALGLTTHLTPAALMRLLARWSEQPHFAATLSRTRRLGSRAQVAGCALSRATTSPQRAVAPFRRSACARWRSWATTHACSDTPPPSGLRATTLSPASSESAATLPLETCGGGPVTTRRATVTRRATRWRAAATAHRSGRASPRRLAMRPSSPRRCPVRGRR